MPKLEPKQVQKELEQGWLWPVYWLHGSERMKSRELLRRIKRAALGESGEAGKGLAGLGFGEENFDGSETPGPAIVDAALSPGLGGGTRFIVVRDAHAIKEADALAELCQARGKTGAVPFVCVFLSKDIDARKKISKILTEKAAVVPCEEVPETEREAWIQYLAKRRGMALPPALAAQLVSLDPWNLDIVDMELEKLSLLGEGSGAAADASEVVLAGAGVSGGADAFLEAFFSRKLKDALQIAEGFADHPDEALPILGLFSWNVRQLALAVSDRERGTKHAKLNPYVADKIHRWSKSWRLGAIVELQAELAALDHGFKQTPLLPLGLWSSLVLKFGNPA